MYVSDKRLTTFSLSFLDFLSFKLTYTSKKLICGFVLLQVAIIFSDFFSKEKKEICICICSKETSRLSQLFITVSVCNNQQSQAKYKTLA